MMLPVQLQGVAKPYQGNGRQLGYPTANIAADTDLQDGVYFGYADLGEFKQQPALIFIGIPTTLGDTERRVEAYLLDIPDQDYYDQTLTVYIREFHRPNQKFADFATLLQAIQTDEVQAREWFTSNPF
jgi:riboflavin kinase/FMN adenylyltransferase